VAVLAVVLAASTASASAASDGSAQPRIVGGVPVSIEDYPWQAAVVRAGTSNAFFRQFCGGSLITSRIVLTAAHCVEDTDPECDTVPECVLLDTGPGDDGTPRIDPHEVEAILGRTVLSSAEGVEHAVIDVAFQGDDLNPPLYNPNTLENDVGYLVLDGATPTTQTQIKLAASDETALWAPGVFADITGWGTTSSGGSRSDALRAGSVPIVSDASCTASYGSDFDSESMVCAGYTQGGVDTCQGDSGGPLQSPLLGGGYRLVGITSWGFSCAQPNFPGVYTRVGEATLRDAIVARVLALENDNGITPNENPVGGGGQPRGGGPTFPPPPGPISQPPVTTTAAAPSTDPFAKCRKIFNKRKRKKCNRKVRRTLNP
jgi:secreted trypsin-like serine protease